MALYQDLTQKVYRRLRKPSQEALPWRTVMDVLADVVNRRKLDLVLSPHNAKATVSDWFTPASNDILLSDYDIDAMLPIRVEVRSVGSDFETGEGVDIVNFDVLERSQNGAVSFYGDPLRMAFRDTSDYVGEREYRIVYESDIFNDEEAGLSDVVGLPAFFASLVVLETALELLDLVEDLSEEYQLFVKQVRPQWSVLLLDRREQWKRYVVMFKGRARVPKRTYFDNRVRPLRTRWFPD